MGKNIQLPFPVIYWMEIVILRGYLNIRTLLKHGYEETFRKINLANKTNIFNKDFVDVSWPRHNILNMNSNMIDCDIAYFLE